MTCSSLPIIEVEVHIPLALIHNSLIEDVHVTGSGVVEVMRIEQTMGSVPWVFWGLVVILNCDVILSGTPLMTTLSRRGSRQCFVIVFTQSKRGGVRVQRGYVYILEEQDRAWPGFTVMDLDYPIMGSLIGFNGSGGRRVVSEVLLWDYRIIWGIR